jgi:hypothetical protein
VEQVRTQDVLDAMTPEGLLSQKGIARPFVIRPAEFPTFDRLLAHREMVRHLRLLPVKQDEMYAAYMEARVAGHADSLAARMTKSARVRVAANAWSYWLPEGTEQHVVWWSKDVTRAEVAEEVARVLSASGLTADEVVMFERPNGGADLVRGTIPMYPHAHIWCAKKLNEDAANTLRKA